ncbi:hypothetical protein [Mycetocola zhujimingii]|uniref:hypothetical protein n=1 Tax=Mycetocola zhujimingii TaxID=2079792 RepID=UPI000D3AEF62|nr:hypothetical protein [Mycetocola zhujimingii]AWB86143.1 hypothetical protein C3E77_05625 [Mycetocola zhujimingii]
MTATADFRASVVLVGGHESHHGADIRYLQDDLDRTTVSPAGRPLHNTVKRLLASSGEPVVVVPMTFGRDPSFVADVAKTLKWLSAGIEAPAAAVPRVALAPDFGTLDHLTAWLRTAATQVRQSNPEAAVLISAASANPFDDAEVFRIAHLVRTHGAGNEVEVAIDDGRGGPAAVDKLKRLGFNEIVVVPAGFQRSPAGSWDNDADAGVRFYGPIMSERAVTLVVHQRVADALHSLGHGNDGIDAGLMADHGHGYAHSHAFEEHEHGHDHGHPHTHSHGEHSSNRDHPDALTREPEAAVHIHHHDNSLIHTQ